MTAARLSPAAQADLDEIWDFSVSKWGVDQAEAYLRGIAKAVQAIATDCRLGRSCDEVRTGYWKYLVGSHVLFYKEGPDGIDVIRILHSHMDFDRHL